MKRYSHDNWNQALALPDGPDKDQQLKIVGHLAKGNLYRFVRQCVAMDKDIKLAQDNPMWDWRLIEPTQFTKQRRKEQNEDLIGKD